LGILISTASKSQQVAMFISLFALMLPTILLSGFIFPIESMPEVLQWIQCHYASTLVYHYHQKYHAERSRNCFRVAGNVDINWYDYIFYIHECEEI
jgi:ABC-type multidrug transport system permease subunit